VVEQGLEQGLQGLFPVFLGLDFAVHRLQDAGDFALFVQGWEGEMYLPDAS